MDVATLAQAVAVSERAGRRMLKVRKLTQEELETLPPLSAACLCGDETVLRMGRSGFSMGYVPLEKAEWRNFPPSLPLPLPELITRMDASAYGAFEEQKFCALAVVCRDGQGWGELLDIRVDAAWRRQGIATALLASCEGFAVRRGLHGLRVTVSDQNPVMCQFLEASGFQVQGMDRFLYSRLPEERNKPLALRACALMCYKMTERG